MGTVVLILLALATAGAITFFLMKKGKIEDKNGNNIPDAIENKIESVKEVVKDVKQVVEKVEKVAKKVTKKPATKKPSVKKSK